MQPNITDYITVDNPNDNLTSTNKKRKTISGELPDPKRQNPKMSSQSSKSNNPPTHPLEKNTTELLTPRETGDKELSVNDKRFLQMEQRLELKMKESVKEGIKESMQEVVDNTLTAAMSKMTDAVNELIKTNRSVVFQQSTLHALEHENKALSYWVQKLKHEQDKLKNKLEVIENKGLESCLIIRGITETVSEDTSSLMEKIYRELSKTIDARSDWERIKLAKEMTIIKCKRLGRPSANRTRPISIEFQYQQDLDYVLGNKKFLRKGIYIDKEYAPDIERRRRLLRPILKAARNLPDYENSCWLEDDHLIIDSKHYTMETLDMLPNALNVFNISSRTNTIGFFRELNPLSNFHKAIFTHENTIYHCSEQFIQHCKAKYFGDQITANKILNTTSAPESKLLSNTIRNFDRRKWEKVAKEQCKPGIKCKFQQNPGLADILTNCTGTKTIVECTTDRLWGNGISLGMDYCLDPDRWTSQGLLGEILEEIRSELKSPHVHHFSTTSLLPPESGSSDTMDFDPEPRSLKPDGLPVETNITTASSSQMAVGT